MRDDVGVALLGLSLVVRANVATTSIGEPVEQLDLFFFFCVCVFAFVLLRGGGK